MNSKSQLFLIGGKEKKFNHPELLNNFLQLINPDSRILLITGASSVPQEQEKIYTEIFKQGGTYRVNTIPFLSRSDGDKTYNLQLLESCDGIFITDGNQVKLTSRMLGTKFHSILMEKISYLD